MWGQWLNRATDVVLVGAKSGDLIPWSRGTDIVVQQQLSAALLSNPAFTCTSTSAMLLRPADGASLDRSISTDTRKSCPAAWPRTGASTLSVSPNVCHPGAPFCVLDHWLLHWLLLLDRRRGRGARALFHILALVMARLSRRSRESLIELLATATVVTTDASPSLSALPADARIRGH